MNLSEKNNYIKFTLGVVAIAFLIIASITLIKNPWNSSNTLASITVSGSGEIKAVPDISRFSVSVSERGKTQALALEKTSKKINTVISELKNLGISEKDISSENVSTYPNYEYVRTTGEQKLVDWSSDHTLSVKVKTLELVPEVQQLFADQGITRVYGPNLSIDDIDSLNNQARNLAITDAKEQAEILAEQLGVKLGKIISFDESGNGYVPINYARTAMLSLDMKRQESSSPEIATGEQTVSSQVSVTYRIK